jgi:hypothetical protein
MQPHSRVAIRKAQVGKARVAAFLLVFTFTVFESQQQMALAAVELKCVSPEKRAKVFERLEQIAGNHYRKTTRNLNSTHLYAVLTGDKNISDCTILAGRALLGGKRGILITSIDQAANKLLVFCVNANLKDCQIKSIITGKTPAGWSRSAISRQKISDGFYAYEVVDLRNNKAKSTLFAPDITPFLLKRE